MALLDGLNILYVEDEPHTREVIAFGLDATARAFARPIRRRPPS
jgi:hypothetical protein